MQRSSTFKLKYYSSSYALSLFLCVCNILVYVPLASTLQQGERGYLQEFSNSQIPQILCIIEFWLKNLKWNDGVSWIEEKYTLDR